MTKVKDVVITDEEVEVFMKKQKTDVFNEGDSFKMVAKGGDISLKNGFGKLYRTTWFKKVRFFISKKVEGWF